jgi:hypothetical protein
MKPLLLSLLTAFSLQSQTLLLHYNFDSNLNDQSGNNFHCTKRSGTPVYVTGQSMANGAVQLNQNANDVFLLPADPILRPDFPMSFTIIFKVNNFNTPLHTLFSTALGTDTYIGANLQVHTNGMLALSIGNNDQTDVYGRRTFWVPPGSIQANVWYRVAAIIRSQNDMELWINCQQYNSSTIDYGCGSVGAITAPYYNGCASVPHLNYGPDPNVPGGMGENDVNGNSYNATNTYWMNGAIDDLKFWSGEIGMEEILEMNRIDTSITVSGNTLSANSSTYSYQWINCTSGTAIAGATNQSYTPSAAGDYAVVLASGQCTDTSACYHIAAVGLPANNAVEPKVFPNPNNGSFQIDIGLEPVSGEVIITNSLGQEVVRENIANSKNLSFDLKVPKGIYFLTIKTGQKNWNAIRLIRD